MMTSKLKPNLFEKYITNHRLNYIINYNISYDESTKTFSWDSAKIYGELTYDSIVDAIIKGKYPTDKMQAIINNYLLDQDDPNIIEEFNNMQAWRQYAKSFAKELLNN